MLLSCPGIGLESRLSQADRAAPPAQRQPHPRRTTEFVICDETIEHGFRDWKHHLRLRLPRSRMVRSARRLGRLVTAVALAYWFTVLVGLRALPRGYARRVLSWGRARVFFLAREFLAAPPPEAGRRLDHLLDWAARVLAPGLPAWRLRYRRFRPAYAPW